MGGCFVDVSLGTGLRSSALELVVGFCSGLLIVAKGSFPDAKYRLHLSVGIG